MNPETSPEMGADASPAVDPVEMPPEGPSTFRLWSVFLAGPVLWVVHFGIVYFAAEATCAAEADASMTFLGPDSFVALVLAVTVLGVSSTTAAAVWARRMANRSEGDRRAFGWMGLLLAVGSAIAIAAVGLPALFLEPCAP